MAVACQDLLDVLSCLADPDALLTPSWLAAGLDEANATQLIEICQIQTSRHLLSCLSAAGPSCEVAHLAEEVHVQHAPAIVTAWVDAALAVASDSCLLSDLGSLASILCSAQRPLTDMFAEALIMSCCSNTGLTGATSASDCTTDENLMKGGDKKKGNTWDGRLGHKCNPDVPSAVSTTRTGQRMLDAWSCPSVAAHSARGQPQCSRDHCASPAVQPCAVRRLTQETGLQHHRCRADTCDPMQYRTPSAQACIAASLTETAGSVEYVVSVLRLLSSVFRHPSVEGRQWATHTLDTLWAFLASSASL
eukprot:1156081-Pelagomonas_calceolata.AAC.3